MKTRMVGLSWLTDGEKKLKTYNRLDSIPACDRRRDGRTSCDGIVRAMHTRRAVKTVEINLLYLTDRDSYNIVTF